MSIKEFFRRPYKIKKEGEYGYTMVHLGPEGLFLSGLVGLIFGFIVVYLIWGQYL